ncbi:uroporphyrinogen-III synthase [Pseudogracilibacillus auburnensis]|uniref:uroporphyrinogen-III synthase n=1 Tax=Pseudogracilibacillus auburnensis TaxID=1494959 RepID=UPI001A97AF2C|nr:uroporphyrinogen-III synthase [Pseudogracilibacillus auburnensis]MBO1005583.1 uroporphyrinogen-III synthase [Pseudogracilibacillus auburnensis]
MMVSHQPLKGKHVLITRGGEQGEKFCTDVATAGGVPYMIPLIAFRAHTDSNAPLFLKNMKEYDWIIFTSQNGVHFFFQQIRHLMDESELIHSGIQFAVVGEKTRAALNRYQIPSRFMPNVYTADDFAREFFQEVDVNAEKVLIPKGNLASKTIAESFRARKIVADEWIVYDTYYPTAATDQLVKLLKKDLLDVAAFTSPSTFHHFNQIVTQHHLQLHTKDILMAAIGTVTKRSIEQAGYQVPICPATFTIDHLFTELCAYFKE